MKIIRGRPYNVVTRDYYILLMLDGSVMPHVKEYFVSLLQPIWRLDCRVCAESMSVFKHIGTARCISLQSTDTDQYILFVYVFRSVCINDTSLFSQSTVYIEGGMSAFSQRRSVQCMMGS